MKIADVVEIIEAFAPLSTQEAWDNSGLNVGSAQRELTGIVVSFDCTPEVIDYAIENGCNLIVTHHPLIFRPLKALNPDGDLVQSMVCKLVKHDISIYCTHTPADKAAEGVNAVFASKVGLANCEILDDESGIGLIGELPEAMSETAFAEHLKSAFGLPYIKASQPQGKTIKRVAICGGSGSSFISLAKAKGADAYVTGDLSYHYFFTQDGPMLFDIGHYESEVGIIDILFSKICSEISVKFTNFAYCILRYKNVNPVNYL